MEIETDGRMLEDEQRESVDDGQFRQNNHSLKKKYLDFFEHEKKTGTHYQSMTLG